MFSGGCAPLLPASFFRPRGNLTVPGMAEPQEELPGHLKLREGTANLWETSKAPKQLNFDRSDGANGARNELSIER